jgi:hypothetical protein
MTNPTPLTQDELRAAAYFAVGVTSEGSIGGRDVSYRLSFAGSVGRDGRMNPVGNSGYSFGTLQIDLGQHPEVARDLLDEYQRWAVTQRDSATLRLDEGTYATTLASLQRTGREMRAAQAHDIDRTDLNRFLASEAGKSFVHGLDTQHVEGVTRTDATVGNRDSALERLQRTTLYRDAADDEQARLAGLFMKLQNQSGQAYTPRLLSRIEQGELTSADDVKTAIDGLQRNQANGNPDYIESGADNTLRGVGVFNALRSASADNPIGTAWSAVVASPLVGPVAAHAPDARNANLGVQYDTVRSLFLTPEGSQRMIRALDAGETLAEGDPALRNGRRSAGFFVAGQDFVHWNANGQGMACIGGQWRSVDPDQLRRVANRDGTVDLQLTENGRSTTLLHVDPQARRVDPHAPARQPAGAAPERGTLHDARHPGHPDHVLYRQAEEAVRSLDAGMGRAPDVSSERMAASMLRLAKENGLTRIDHVVLSRQNEYVAGGQNVFVVQGALGNPASLHAHMPTDQAIRTPVETSLLAAQPPPTSPMHHQAMAQAQDAAEQRHFLQRV